LQLACHKKKQLDDGFVRCGPPAMRVRPLRKVSWEKDSSDQEEGEGRRQHEKGVELGKESRVWGYYPEGSHKRKANSVPDVGPYHREGDFSFTARRGIDKNQKKARGGGAEVVAQDHAEFGL